MTDVLPEMILKGVIRMKIRTIGRHIKEGFKSIRRNGWMSCAASSAAAITLLRVGGGIASVRNINELATKIEHDARGRVYGDIAAEEEDHANRRPNLANVD